MASEPLRVAFVSLGCAKNLVDSEKMLGQLAEAGLLVGADESDADVIVINTCGFIEPARAEADGAIRRAVARKARGRVRRVVVAGCLVQRDQAHILRRIPGVDALVGVNNRDDIVRAVLGSGVRRGRGHVDQYLEGYHRFTQLDTARLRLTPRHYAYLRIGEGCDQKCTFCTIPLIRGPMHCKPPEIVVAEARELVGDGAREINLIAQDTTSYGMGDDFFDGGLASLLRRLDGVAGLRWVRLMYAYPSVMTEEIIEAIADCEHVCKYVDLPLQHINDRMLKAMGRGVDRVTIERLLHRVRERIKGVTIRTTLIAGFPGETEEEFKELVSFVQAFRFDALGVFPYSREPETPAARMSGHVTEEVKQQRVDALMRVQQEVAFALADERIGRQFDVLVEQQMDDNTLLGRHEGQAPGVDSVTYIRGCGADPGEFVTVQCIGRDGYDLVTTPAGATLSALSA